MINSMWKYTPATGKWEGIPALSTDTPVPLLDILIMWSNNTHFWIWGGSNTTGLNASMYLWTCLRAGVDLYTRYVEI